MANRNHILEFNVTLVFKTFDGEDLEGVKEFYIDRLYELLQPESMADLLAVVIESEEEEEE